jgi:hypothetical protein
MPAVRFPIRDAAGDALCRARNTYVSPVRRTRSRVGTPAKTPRFQCVKKLLHHGVGGVGMETPLGHPAHHARRLKPHALTNGAPEADERAGVQSACEDAEIVDLATLPQF